MDLLIFLLVLSILVLVHEFGHFIVAKRAGVKVEEFGLGLPLLPKLVSVKFGETIYSLYPVLFGGFVRLYGEETKVEKESNRAFSSKPRLVRASVIVAGVFMNLVLAVVAFSILYGILGVPRPTSEVKIVGISSTSPIASTPIKEGSVVVSIDGEKISSNKDFIKAIENRKGKEALIEFKSKDGSVASTKIVPRASPPEGEGPLGVGISDTEQYFPPLWQRPFVGAWYGIQEALGWGIIVFGSLAGLFTTLLTTASLPKDLAGPVGIFQITGTVAQQGGILGILQLLGILSINLAILNVIPFPALDGGRLLFVIIEAIAGKRAREVIPKIEQKANMIGFALLIALIIAITIQDVKRLIGR